VNPAVFLEAELAQTAAKLQAELLVLEECLVGVATLLKVSPLLVHLLLNAIDHLLDLLVLRVQLDQLAGGDSLAVSIQASGTAKVIICGRNILRRAQDQTVLRGWVPTGNGLSFDGLVAGRLDREGALLGHARLDDEVALRHFCGSSGRNGKRRG